MCNINLIEGYDELGEKLGYEPCLHDHRILKCTFEDSKIEMEMKSEENIRYTLIFENVTRLNLDGYLLSEVGDIFDMEVVQVEEEVFGKVKKLLKATLDPSFGVGGEITCKRIIAK